MLLVTDPEQDSNEEQESDVVAVYRQVREVQRREAFGVGLVLKSMKSTVLNRAASRALSGS
jgi:hypothetical protein